MKERPILFSAPMVRALLDGSKTQTRRIVKPQPEDSWVDDGHGNPTQCPYGDPVDRLWVRETWQYWDWTEDGMPWIKYRADDSIKFFDSTIPEEWAERVENIWAELSEDLNYLIDNAARDQKWRPSIFMPRWASRITLEITGVRVEPLRDISMQDAFAEGCMLSTSKTEPLDYQNLWDTINGKGSWDANPWVWVIEFKMIT